MIGPLHAGHADLFLASGVKGTQLIVEVPGTEKKTAVQDAAVAQFCALDTLQQGAASGRIIKVVAACLPVNKQTVIFDGDLCSDNSPVFQLAQ